MSEVQQYFLLFRTHVRMFRSRALVMARESRLMVLLLASFLTVYGVLGFWGFGRGIELVEKLPGVGGFLGDRIIYLIFFFFLIMLIFSVGITNYIGMIKGPEIRWLLTLPLSHRVLFLWKSTEALFAAGWSVLFLSTPLLLSFAIHRGAPWSFYPFSSLALLAFLFLAGSAGSLLFLILLKWISRPVALVVGGVAALALLAYGGIVAVDAQQVKQQRTLGVVAVDKVLKHTEGSVHPLSPSTWLSRSVIQWTRKKQVDSGFHSFVLTSWALMGVMAACWAGRGWFYLAWNHGQERNAEAASRQRAKKAGLPMEWPLRRTRVLGMGRALRAVIAKDVLTFFREPSQWVQFLVVFGLLLIYALNLRNLGYNYRDPFWASVISYVNLTVSALAV
ncbi:MAG: hypothetical protein AAF191_13280, partial [Verrucomicrobiota bacterium]